MSKMTFIALVLPLVSIPLELQPISRDKVALRNSWLHHSFAKIIFPKIKVEMAFRKFLNGVITMPVVHADDEEELVDPQTSLREQCQSKGNIEALYNKYQACNDRVNSRSKTTENCMEELFDYVSELDHCVAHSLFSKLK